MLFIGLYTELMDNEEVGPVVEGKKVKDLQRRKIIKEGALTSIHRG